MNGIIWKHYQDTKSEKYVQGWSDGVLCKDGACPVPTVGLRREVKSRATVIDRDDD
ncbi:MAG: hypothetical protein AAB209_12550 [Bacteroidota bacterium]|jgi:hypothetical protein